MNWLTKKLFKKKSSHSNKPSSENTLSNKKLDQAVISTHSDEKLSPEELKHFVPLRNLTHSALEDLPHSIQVFSKQTEIFTQGTNSSHIHYVLKGTVKIQPQSKNSYLISDDDIRARLPLNTAKKHGATATSETKVSILSISADLNQLWADNSGKDISCIDIAEIELPKELEGHPFFKSFSEAYQRNQLNLPSLPNVAIKLKKAMSENIGVNEAVEIIQLDPPIVTKLIQISNSPAYAGINPITNCHNAVSRLGLAATRNLVLGISLKQMFTSKDKQLMKSMQRLWINSLYIASLSFILASESGRSINPEDALLAGLVADIGNIPLLHFASKNLSQFTDIQEIENAIPYLKAPVGTLVLQSLGFSEELTILPHRSEDWFFDSGNELTVTDLVILAKLHSHIQNKKIKNLPYINSIPAYAKLKDGTLGPDFSLQVLHKAQDQIRNTMKMFS